MGDLGGGNDALAFLPSIVEASLPLVGALLLLEIPLVVSRS